MKTMGVFLGALLVFGTVLPVAAQVVDFGDGIKWDVTALERAKPALGPADTEYHKVSEPGRHIPPETTPAAFAPGKVPVLPGEEPRTGPAQTGCALGGPAGCWPAN